METFTIGEVAKRAAVGIDTVRYYERHHLLPAAPRRLSGYREYGKDDVRRLRFIRRAKELGFTLAEISELLTLSTDRERGVREVKSRAQMRLTDIDRRIHELKKMQRALKQLIEACPGHGALEQCPILRALGDQRIA